MQTWNPKPKTLNPEFSFQVRLHEEFYALPGRLPSHAEILAEGADC